MLLFCPRELFRFQNYDIGVQNREQLEMVYFSLGDSESSREKNF